MALTEKGYKRDTFEDVLFELTLKAQELFGEDIDTSDQTPLGKILSIMAYSRAKANEEAELIYYSRFPNTANDINLDRLCPYVGITRNVATPSQYEVTVTGEEGTTIPLEFLVGTESGVQFWNTTEVTIPEGESTCNIVVECTENGTIGNVLLSEITEIVNPEAGIDSVIGYSVVTLGTDEESDYELRERMLEAGEGGGSCNEASIRATILKVPTVTSTTVIVNDTDEVDEYGNLPRSIACYVAGGENYSYEIGEAIFASKPAGIKTNGTISVDVIDDGGYLHEIKYNNMRSINVYVQISITPNKFFEGDIGYEQIRENITSYINSLGFGETVILSSLYGYIYSVEGVGKVDSLLLSTDGSTYTDEDITITELQCANCIEVTFPSQEVEE